MENSPIGIHSIGSNKSIEMRSRGGDGAGGGKAQVDDIRPPE